MPPPELPINPQKWDTFFRIAMGGIDGAVGVLKIFFVLDTGAAVLFVNLLARLHEPRSVLVPLDLSIFSFGVAAILTLPAFMAVVEFRGILAHMMTNEVQGISDWQGIFNKDVEAWDKKYQKKFKWMGRLFYTGIVFAGVFVLAITFVR